MPLIVVVGASLWSYVTKSKHLYEWGSSPQSARLTPNAAKPKRAHGPTWPPVTDGGQTPAPQISRSCRGKEIIGGAPHAPNAAKPKGAHGGGHVGALIHYVWLSFHVAPGCQTGALFLRTV